MMYPQQQQNHPPELGVVYGILMNMLRGVAHTGEMFTRKPGTIGKRAHGMFVPLFAAILMAIWAYLWANEYMHTGNPEHRVGPFVLFGIAWALMAWAHIIGRGLRDHWGGWYPPLSYDGASWFRFRNWDAVKIKDKLEPVIVALAGIAVALMGNLPLALWLGITSFCMAGAASHDKWQRKERVREMDDMLDRQMEQVEDMRRWGRGRW